MFKELYNWTLSWALTPQAEIALFLIALAESSFFPIPPDVLLIAMAVADPSRAFWFALVCSVGSVIGGIIGYKIGKYGGQPMLKRFVKQKSLERVEHLFNRFDAWAISIAGFTPIPFKVFTIASGAFQINFRTFVIASVVGRAGRFFLIATLFYFWGEQVQYYLEEYFNVITLILVGLVVLGVLAFRFARHLKRKDNDGNPDGNSNHASLNTQP